MIRTTGGGGGGGAIPHVPPMAMYVNYHAL